MDKQSVIHAQHGIIFCGAWADAIIAQTVWTCIKNKWRQTSKKDLLEAWNVGHVCFIKLKWLEVSAQNTGYYEGGREHLPEGTRSFHMLSLQ